MTKALIITWLLFWLPGSLAAQDPQALPPEWLSVYYIHRPPYYATLANGQAGGFLVAAARMIFDRADLNHRFVQLPPKRILRYLQSSRYACSVGWFRTPERERFARFSEPFYQNRPLGAVMRRSAAAGLPERASLEQLLRSDLVLGVINGFSYGELADTRIRQVNPRLQRVPNSPRRLLRMILRGRVDWVLMAPEEALFLMRTEADLADGLLLVPLLDIPPGNRRHIMYSRGVPRGIVQRVDRTIRQIVREPSYRRLLRHGGAAGLQP